MIQAILREGYAKDPWCHKFFSASRGMPELTIKDRLWFLGERLLIYSVIRKEMLKLPHINPNRFFLPKVPIDVSFGDVGYMKDDVFVKFDNMPDTFTDHNGKAIKGSDDYLTASGPIISEDLGEDVIRLVHLLCISTKMSRLFY